MRAIKFTVTKRGQTHAYKWQGHYGCHGAPGGPLGRWLRVGLEEAKLEIATGQAYRFEDSTTDDPKLN